ncbi:2-C-methyl-D-erythritol 4-phosphate cytidylyltransferase [Thermomicrobium sp. 4228-Ro]|uniref:2-C-methyl-D-erythritol 4-phosphate cytidylyltransferase n=1 Tax=Thermomicrobium sp. 4228-Ro TaxID=2993937 RepID=UPI0022497AE7|nr:2-C-methyl-D-erythritol 4-phosphate cytidylyltransferase [Thermomicrobium sp. 4228-Ro]MCX2726857.1 2-C-methyl-D-erythritol 4-phosphate cytidylyltransferase [Thermomicrobium sp. 4228-Ro]
MSCGAVVPAAGRGQRLGGRDKALVPLAGRPALAWVLEALDRSGVIDTVVVVTNQANCAAVEALCSSLGLTVPVRIVLGGAERALSVRAGVEALEPNRRFVLVHDAARPLVTPELIRRAVEAVQRHGAVVAAVPVVDTIKQVALDGRVVTTPDRASLVAAQTPQVFRLDWLHEAYRRVGTGLAAATDEAVLLERAGFPVYVFPGDPENLKVTTPLDVTLAEFLLERRRRG